MLGNAGSLLVLVGAGQQADLLCFIFLKSHRNEILYIQDKIYTNDHTISTLLQGEELIITIDTSVDITLEKGLFYKRADFFEEVYSVKPVIRQKNN